MLLSRVLQKEQKKTIETVSIQAPTLSINNKLQNSHAHLTVHENDKENIMAEP